MVRVIEVATDIDELPLEHLLNLRDVWFDPYIVRRVCYHVETVPGKLYLQVVQLVKQLVFFPSHDLCAFRVLGTASATDAVFESTVLLSILSKDFETKRNIRNCTAEFLSLSLLQFVQIRLCKFTSGDALDLVVIDLVLSASFNISAIHM